MTDFMQLGKLVSAKTRRKLKEEKLELRNLWKQLDGYQIHLFKLISENLLGANMVMEINNQQPVVLSMANTCKRII